MTVAEHILFYSLLKGRPIAEAEEEVENMLQDLGLPHKRDELIQNLSGLSESSVIQNKLQESHMFNSQIIFYSIQVLQMDYYHATHSTC